MKKLVKVLSIAAVAAAALLTAQQAQAWWGAPGVGPGWGGPWGGYGPYAAGPYAGPYALGAYGPGSTRYQRCLAREARGAWWGELPHPPGYCEKYRYRW
jgi:hypothetical protein